MTEDVSEEYINRLGKYYEGEVRDFSGEGRNQQPVDAEPAQSGAGTINPKDFEGGIDEAYKYALSIGNITEANRLRRMLESQTGSRKGKDNMRSPTAPMPTKGGGWIE